MADRTTLNLATPCDSPPIHFSDVSVVRCEGAQYLWEFEGGVPSSSTGSEADVYYDNAGAYDVTLTVINSEGAQNSITWENLITVTNEGVVEDTGFSEDFDGDAFPPEHWRMETPGHAWEHAYDLQNASNGVAQFPNYWVNTNGAHDMLITPGFNPAYIETVSFDYAHMKYSSYVDGLQVVGKLSGEEEWTVLWERYGDYLSVPGCYTWFWYDTGGSIAWENALVNVPDYWANSDASCAEIAFVNVGGYGNHIWIDNVVVEGTIDCSADLNNDNSITVADLLLVLSEFGCVISCEGTDVNGDSLTTVSDLLEILSVFGTICN
jgi:PKD repeat protein